MKKQLSIGIVVYRNCTSSMVTGVWDILMLADNLFQQRFNKPLLKIELIGETTKAVSSFSGLTFTPHRSIRSSAQHDLIYVPGFIGDIDEVLMSNSNLIKWLGRIAGSSRVVLAAACNGNFLLAQSGALNRKKATTHWSVAAKFRKDFSQVTLEEEKILIDNGTVISAAGVTAYFNLALHIIQRFASDEIAHSCAKIFLVDSGRRIQTPYQLYQFPKAHGDLDILKIQDWLEANYKEKVALEMMAEYVGMGKKTFTRRFKKATGETPQAYLQKLRIETAKRHLESGTMTFSEVTWHVGYTDVSSFHKAFKHETTLTPIEYRNRFLI